MRVVYTNVNFTRRERAALGRSLAQCKWLQCCGSIGRKQTMQKQETTNGIASLLDLGLELESFAEGLFTDLGVEDTLKLGASFEFQFAF